jgi:TPR repeat protein
MTFLLNKKLHIKVFNSKILSILLVSILGIFISIDRSSIWAKSPLTESLGTIQSKALNGDSHYQGALALFHKFGERGLAIDLQEAERWAKLASEKEGAIGLCTLAALSLESGKINRGHFLYDEAYLHSNLLALAKGKDPLAMYCLGMIEMDNPPRNFTKAIRHLEASAEKGFATAQATLGMIYFTGIGVKKDSNLAVKWCSRAAREKLPLGMFYLGMAYSIGDSLEINEDYSLRWIRSAADRELVMAQLMLGMKYAKGDGVEKNLENAVSWLHRASISGSSEAKLQLRKYENHLERLRNPPAVYIPENQTKAVSNLAEFGIHAKNHSDSELPRPIIRNPKTDITAEDEIGFDAVEAAMTVLTIDKDREKAKTLLETPALKGNPIACRQLGLIFYKENEYKTAKKWFEKAAIKEDPESLRYLGILFFLGQGVSQDYPTADKWLTKAAQFGDLEASRYLRIVKQFY